MSRRSARLSAYQLIFGYLFSKEVDSKTYDAMLNAEDISESDEIGRASCRERV